MSEDDDPLLSIPDFLRVSPDEKGRPEPKSETKVMKQDADTPATEAEEDAPAPKAKAKPVAKAKANGAAKPDKVKAAPKKEAAKTPAKASAKDKAKPAPKKAKAERQRDPDKLDIYGLRKDSNKSVAAGMYARKGGATLNEVKEKVGSVQFNVLTELRGKGFVIDEKTEKGDGPRPVTRYFLKPKK